MITATDVAYSTPVKEVPETASGGPGRDPLRVQVEVAVAEALLFPGQWFRFEPVGIELTPAVGLHCNTIAAKLRGRGYEAALRAGFLYFRCPESGLKEVTDGSL